MADGQKAVNTEISSADFFFLRPGAYGGICVCMSGAQSIRHVFPGEDAGRPTVLPLKYFYNANIRTFNAAHPLAPHMLVAGERIWFCSDQRAPLGIDFRESGFSHQRKLFEHEIEFIDLQGRTVLPSFGDAHIHFLWWALNASRPDLTEARSEDDAIRLLLAQVGSIPRGEWIVGHGWSHNSWPGGKLPSRASLDKAFPHNPVYLVSKCGHLAWLNSLALSIVGITPDTPDPAGGEISREKKETGIELTGILKEDAVLLVEEVIPRPSPSSCRNAFLKAQLLAHSMGITSVHTPEEMSTWEFYSQMRALGLLRLRIAFLFPAANLDDIIRMRLRHGVGDNLLFVGGIKVFADGSLGARTALLYQPYENEPDNFGSCVREEKEIEEITIRSNRAGLPVAVHAIGDRAVGDVLRAFESAAKEVGCCGASDTRPLVRNRIEHMQLFAPVDKDLIREIRPVASVQPVHLCADWKPAMQYWGKRARYAYAFRKLLELGCSLAFGSDGPVEPINPWWGIHAAVNRQDLEGEPPKGWYPEERLDVEQAIVAYTVGVAHAAGKQNCWGTLQPGKYADFIVVDEDPCLIDSQNIRNLSVAQTYMSGECVFKKKTS
jgi:predicted amidohydrolase YtcJ